MKCLSMVEFMLCLLAFSILTHGCRQDSSPAIGSSEVEVDPAVKARDVLIFPDTLKVEDAQVNAFVVEAMTVCAAGDYDRFRLLWSVREEPLPRHEYERGWQAVEEIRLRVLQQVALAADAEAGRDQEELVYLMFATVSLDPQHPAAQDKPIRDVVLILVQERDTWRLAGAPRSMRAWVKKHFNHENPDQTEVDGSVSSTESTGP